MKKSFITKAVVWLVLVVLVLSFTACGKKPCAHNYVDGVCTKCNEADPNYVPHTHYYGLCRSAQVRQALALAIDRESIAQVDYARHAAASTLPVHPDSPLYDVEKAAALAYAPEALSLRLEELKLTGRALTLLVNSENAARVSAANRLAQQLRWTGLEITVEKLAFEDYTAALEQGKFDLYLGEVVLTADFDLSSMLLPGAPLNYGDWSDAAVSPLLSMYRASEGTQRSINARLMYGHLAQEVPIAPIAFKNGCVLTRWGRLSGLNPVRGNVFYHLEGWTII